MEYKKNRKLILIHALAISLISDGNLYCALVSGAETGQRAIQQTGYALSAAAARATKIPSFRTSETTKRPFSSLQSPYQLQSNRFQKITPSLKPLPKGFPSSPFRSFSRTSQLRAPQEMEGHETISDRIKKMTRRPPESTKPIFQSEGFFSHPKENPEAMQYNMRKRNGLKDLENELVKLLPISRWTDRAINAFIQLNTFDFYLPTSNGFTGDLTRNQFYNILKRLKQNLEEQGKDADIPYDLYIREKQYDQAQSTSTKVFQAVKNKLGFKKSEVTEKDIELFISNILKLEQELFDMLRKQIRPVEEWSEDELRVFYSQYVGLFSLEPRYNLRDGYPTHSPHTYFEPVSPADALDVQYRKYFYQLWAEAKERLGIKPSDYKSSENYKRLPYPMKNDIDLLSIHPTVENYLRLDHKYDRRDMPDHYSVIDIHGKRMSGYDVYDIVRSAMGQIMNEAWHAYHTQNGPDPAASWKQWQKRFFGSGAGGQSNAATAQEIHYPDDFYTLPQGVQAEIKQLAQLKDSKALNTEYRKLMVKYHPDTHPKESVTFGEYTKIINNIHDQAKEILQQSRTE